MKKQPEQPSPVPKKRPTLTRSKMRDAKIVGPWLFQPRVFFPDMRSDIPHPIYVNGSTVTYRDDGTVEVHLYGEVKADLPMPQENRSFDSPRKAGTQRRAFLMYLGETARAVEGLAHGQVDDFCRALALLGPRVLLEPKVMEEVDKWWRQKNTLKDEQAKHNLERIGTALATLVSGRHELSGEKKEAIVDSCKMWRPLCAAINKACKKLWKLPEYKSSEQYRKDASGKLAEQLLIPIEDVQAIEAFLSNPSRTARKRTPHDAMLHRVAREFPGVGKKTVEKIWGDYLKTHPEERKSRRFTT